MVYKDNSDSSSPERYSMSNVAKNRSSESSFMSNLSVDKLTTSSENIPPSPQLNINRVAYSLPNFNARFRRTSKVQGARPRSATSDKVIEKITPSCPSPLNFIRNLFPIIDWLWNYQKSDLVPDIISGVTVAIFQVPESMGYSFVANVSPVTCLYTSFFPSLIYAIMGTSRHCSIGTLAAVALMTGTIIKTVQTENNMRNMSDYQTVTDDSAVLTNMGTYQYTTIEIAMVISFLVGCYQIIFGIFRFGFVSVYMSEQLINGFTCAIAYHVLVAQFKHMLGVEIPTRDGLLNLIWTIVDIIKILEKVNVITLIVSILSVVILLFFKLYLNEIIANKLPMKIQFPAEILIVIGGVVASSMLHLKGNHNVKIIGHIPRGLPSPSLPYWSLIKILWAQCIPLSIVAYTLTFTVGKTFGFKHDYETDSNQEFISLGASNLFGSFFSCIPVAASLSRSSVQESSGGRTQLVSLVNCVGILAVLLYFGSLLETLPNAVLASIIAVALRTLLFQVMIFKKYWEINKLDSSIWFVTFFSVIILNIDIGLYIGLIWSLLTLIYKSQHPKIYLLGTVGSQSDVYIPIGKYINAEEVSGIKIYQFCGPLHFANIDYFKDGLKNKMEFSVKEIKAKNKKSKKLVSSSQQNIDMNDTDINIHTINVNDIIAPLPSHIIIDCSMFSYIDTAGVKTLKSTVQEYESIGVKTFLSGCPSHVTKILEKDFFYAAVPEHHVYISTYDAIQHAIVEQNNISVVIDEEDEDNNDKNSDDSNNNVDDDRNDQFISVIA